MATIKMKLPVDLSLTNMLLYEGIMYLLAEGPSKDFNFSEAKLDEGFLVQVFDKIYRKIEQNQKDKNLISKINFINNVKLSYNDKKSLRKLFKNEFFSIGDLIYIISKDIKEIDKKMSLANEIDFAITGIGKGGKIYYGSRSGNQVSLQLFKVDRYTGLSSTEAPYTITSNPLTSYFSLEVFLIALLGLYSSIVMSKGNNYYFMFFSPTETMYILSKSDRNVLHSYWDIKQKVGEIISEAFKAASFNEIMILELMLNIELHNLLVRKDINKVSLVLFRVNREGDTYKIYELIPFTIYRDTLFHRKIEEYFDDPEGVVRFVERFLRSGSILSALENRERKDASNVLAALRSIYRFVVLGDIQAWYNVIRELFNAERKLESESPKSMQEIKKKNELLESYRRLLGGLPGAKTYAG